MRSAMGRKTAVMFGYLLGLALPCIGSQSDPLCLFNTDPEDPSPIFWYIQSFHTTWLEAPPAPDGSEGWVNIVRFDTELKNILLEGALVRCTGGFRFGAKDPPDWVTCEAEGGSGEGGPVVSAQITTSVEGGIILALRQKWECEEDKYVTLSCGEFPWLVQRR